MSNFRYLLSRCCYFFLILLLSFSSCTDATKSNIEPSVKEKTYLKILNNTGFAVNVYINDPPLYNASPETLRHVPVGGSQEWELQPSATGGNGETLYFEYLIPIGSTVIPYYPNSTDYVKIKKLEAGIINTQEVPALSSAKTDSIFILIKNDSKDTTWFQQGIYTRNPFGSSVRDISANGDALFVFDGSTTSLQNCTVGNLTRHYFQDTVLEKGYIYTFIYDGMSDPGIYLIEHFDLDMQKSIWTIPTVVEPVPKGRFFTVGLLSSRQNPRTDGYILTGRVNYDEEVVTNPQAGALPYLGMISPTGTIKERRINLNKNPAGLNLRRFIENSNELVYVGQAYYEDTIGQPFILSTDKEGRENYFYDEFNEDLFLIDARRELHGYKITKWGNNFAIGCEMWEYHTDWKLRLYVAKVEKASWDKVVHEEFWCSPFMDDLEELIELIYDETHNMFVVLAQTNTGSTVYFIDAANGTLKYPTTYLNNYYINGFFSIGQDYYIVGAYQGVANYRGFITKIDVVNGKADTMNTRLVDSTKYSHGGAGIYNVLPETDKTIILGGWCAELGYDDGHKPWLVKYDLNERKIVWEQIYDTHDDYIVYSVHHNAIGSYLLETYNDITYHSYLISTDLLGNVNENMLAPLPRDTSLFNAIEPGKPFLDIEIAPIADEALLTSTTYTVIIGQSIVINSSNIYNPFQWYINGTPVAGANASSFIFTTTGRKADIYNVTVVGTIPASINNGVEEKRSAGCRITVTN